METGFCGRVQNILGVKAGRWSQGHAWLRRSVAPQETDASSFRLATELGSIMSSIVVGDRGDFNDQIVFGFFKPTIEASLPQAS